MNPKDEKNFEQVKRIVRNLEQEGIYSVKKLEGIINDRGIVVYNMNSVMQAIMKKTHYLQQLTNGNYVRKRD